jgi:WD40 repeat protein
MTSIFISHRSIDADVAADLKSWLASQGHKNLFLDFDPVDGIPAGADWEQTIYRKLRQSQALLVVLTPGWLASRYCFAEFALAREQGKAIFVARAKPTPDGPLLPAIQEVDLTVDRDAALTKLARGLKDRGLDPRDAFDWDPDRPIYPGLAAFEERDAAIFFGRSEESWRAVEALERLRLQGAGAERLLLITGASGSGKSSLMRAGVLPRLRKDLGHWVLTPPFRPGADPIRELASSFAAAFAQRNKPEPAGLREQLGAAAACRPAKGHQLCEIARDLVGAAGQPAATLLLALDQIEELLGPEVGRAADDFLQLLSAGLAAADRELMVLGTIRSDMLGQWQQYPAIRAGEDRPELAFEAFPLGPLSLERVSDVVRGPARYVGLAIDDGALDRMRRDVGTPDALPLLAYTLRQLYDRYGSFGRLTLENYDGIGGLEGSIRNEAEAVVKLARLSVEERDALRAAFVPTMVRATESGQVIRQRAFREQIPRRAAGMIDKLVDARLLVADRDDQHRETVEIAHDALLRVWPTLVSWIADDADKLRTLDGVRRAAAEWRRASCRIDLLVHRGERLHEIDRLVDEPRFREVLSSDIEYLDACRQAERALEEERIRAENVRLNERRVSYLNRIALAERYWLEGQFQRADEVLGDCTTEDDCGWEWRYLKGQLRADLVSFDVTGGICGLGFSGEAPYKLIWASRTGLLGRWDLSANAPVATTVKTGGSIAGFGLSQGGRLVLSDDSGTLRIWDHVRDVGTTIQSECVAGWDEGDIPNSALSISSDGRRAAWIAPDHTIHVLEIDPRRELTTLPADRYRKVAFHPDGESIVTLTRSPNFVDDGRIGKIVIRRSGEASEFQLRDVNDFALSLDGELVAVATEAGPVLNRLGEGGRLEFPTTGRPARSLAVAPVGDRLAVRNEDGTIDIWSISNGRVLHSLQPGEREVGPMAFSPDGRALAVGLGDRIRVWDATTGQAAVTVAHATHRNEEIVEPFGQRIVIGGLSDYVRTVRAQISADASCVATTAAAAIVYSTATAREIFCSSFEVDRRGALIAPNGELLAVSTGFGLYIGDPRGGAARSPVCLLALPSGEQSYSISVDADWVIDLAFGDRGRKIAILAIDRDGRKHLFVCRPGRPEATMRVAAGKDLAGPIIHGMQSGLLAAVVQPAEDGGDRIVRIWDGDAAHCIGEVHGIRAEVSAVTFGGAEDGLLAIADTSGTLRIWNVRSSREEFSVPAQRDRISALALTSDGRRVFTGAESGEIRVFQRPTGREVIVLKGHAAEVSSIALNLDESSLVSASTDGVVKTWFSEIPSGDNRGSNSLGRYNAFVRRGPAWHLAEAERATLRDNGAKGAALHLDWIEPSLLSEAPFLVRLGQAQGELGRWERAWGALSRAAEVGPIAPWVVFQCALVAVRSGSEGDFRRLCEELLDMAERSGAPTELAALAVRACVLSPTGAGGDRSAQGSIAERALALAVKLPQRDLLGPALLRSGAAAGAVEHLSGNPDHPNQGTMWSDYNGLFLVLALSAAEGDHAARTQFARMRIETESSFRAWDDRLELDLLIGEIARLGIAR